MQTRARHPRTLIGTLLGVCLAGACSANEQTKDLAPDVWAVVDGREIRRDAVEKAYRRVASPEALQTTSEDQAMAMKLGLIDELVNQEILLARAAALKLEVTPAELDTAFAERKGTAPEDQFQQQLKVRNLTADDMREALRRELVVQKLMEREVGSKIVISEQDVVDFYNKNRAQFNVAETQYRIAQLVITPVRDPQLRNRSNDDAVTPEQAQKKVQMLLERLKAGTPFSTLAADFSEDPQSALQGGDLGFVSATQLNQVPPPLRNAVLQSEPGNVKVVSAGGAHTLVLLVAREASGQRDLNTPNVREGITKGLRERKEQLLRAAYEAAARNDAKVINNVARLILQTQGQLPNLGPAK